MVRRLGKALAVIAALGVVLAGAVAAQGAPGTGAVDPPAAAGDAAALNYTTYLPVALKSFVAPCSTRPTLISPANGSSLSTISPLYIWDDGNDPAATGARLQLAYDPAFSDGAGSLRSVVKGYHEFRFSTNLRPGSTVYWRAWMMCGDTQGPYSEVWSFTTASSGTTLPAPEQIAPANGSTWPGTAVTLQWAPVSGAVEYLLRWRLLGERGYSYDFLGATQMAMWELEPTTTYEWWVSARNDYAIGTDSPLRQFTTGAAPGGGRIPGVMRGQVVEQGGTAIATGAMP